MAWENIDGKISIIDAQSGDVYSDATQFASMAGQMKSVVVSRLDNVDLNTDFLQRWVTNA